MVPLADLHAAGPELAGSKAKGLAALLRGGFPVPDGFAVVCDALALHLSEHGLGPLIRERLDSAQSGGDGLAEASREIRGAIVTRSIPSRVAAEVAQALDGIGRDTRLAVRSSATAEDLAGASFAGQYDTFLDAVGLDAVLRRIRDCWASLFGERALVYRLRQGMALDDVSMGCVVQALVPAESAGVAFTAEPLTGRRDRIVVNAVRGLGDSLVSGTASADSFVLARGGGEPLERWCASGEPALDGESLERLRGLAIDVERWAGAPQDVEWAVAGGRVFLLQARPITGLPAEPVPLADAERPIFGFAERIREIVPNPVTPLLGDITVSAVLPLLAEALARRGVPTTAETPARLIRGRLYLDVTAFSRIAAAGLDELQFFELLDHGRRPPLRAWRLGALLQALRRTPLAVRFLADAWRLEAQSREAERGIAALLARYRQMPLEALDDLRLLGLIRLDEPQTREELIRLPPANAVARGLVPLAITALGYVCARWLGEPEAAAALVSGLPDLFEVECAAAIFDLAKVAEQQPAVAEALRSDAEHALERLAGRPEAAAFRSALQAFLERFGHRAVEEVELSRPRWAEDPRYVLGVVAGQLARPVPDPREGERRRRAQREAKEAWARRRLRWRPLRRSIFEVVLRVAQASSVASENTKSDIMKLFQYVRAAILERGARLVRAERLAEANDAFFLDLDELGSRSGDLRALVAQRRADWRQWHREPAPRLIDAAGRPILEALPSRADVGDSQTLIGIGACPGIVRGRARIVTDPARGVRFDPGDILVAPFTDPGWTPLFLSVAAVVVETGSMLSHASIVARELRLPSVVGVAHVTTRLVEGETIEVDGARGLVRRLPS